MSSYRLKIALILILGLFFPPCNADKLDKIKADWRFQEPPYANKISHPTILSFAQQANGYIWIGTADGLNRFDGQDNKVYRSSSKNPYSLSHSVINDLYLDNSGALWVATESGLDRYDSKLDRFISFDLNQVTKSIDTTYRVSKIFEDSQKRLWIGTHDGGMFLITADRKNVLQVKLSKKILFKEKLAVRDVIESKSKNIWVASNYGLLALDSESEEFVFPQTTHEHSNLVRGETYALSYLKENKILVANNYGLFSYEPDNNRLIQIKPNLFKSKFITQIHQLENDKLLIGTQRSGLFLFNLSSQSYKQFTIASDKNSSIPDNQINSIFKSNNQNIWIATNLGIVVLDINQQSFGHFKAREDLTNCLAGNTIYSILQDSHDMLWIAAFGQGLTRINITTGQCKKFDEVLTSKQSKPLQNIVTLYEDEFGVVWAGSYGEGVFKFDRKLQQFSDFDASRANGNRLTTKGTMRTIHGNGNGKIWFAVYRRGIFELNTQTNKLTNFYPPQQNHSLYMAKAIEDIKSDSSNNLWIATAFQGLWKYNLNSKTFSPIKSDKTNTTFIPDRLSSVTLDKENNVWIGSEGSGVFSFNTTTEEINNYSIEDGLLSNIILKILQDSKGDMWFLTDKGLSRLSQTSKNIQTFLKQDGLQADAFTNTGFFDSTGNILTTGGINGFNRFDVRNIKKQTKIQSEVQLTSFELFYKPVQPSDNELTSPLSQSIGLTKKISLNYDQNVFAFTFSSMEFISPEQISYQFMLQGYDTDWNTVNYGRRYANYTNISPGDYKFRVKASNKLGEWNDLVTEVEISIAFPWWQTNSAYFVFTILTFLLIYFFIIFRTKSLTLRAKELEQSVIRRTRELGQEKNKVELLLSRKNEEFANVSHEFRTPLTLILGPLAQILKTNTNSEEIDRLNIVQRNAYRLLRMVDQLLNIETFRIKSISQKSPQAIGRIIRLLVEAFADLAKEKDIQLVIQETIEINFEFTNDAIEKIVLNLLSNAIKYSKPGGVIKVSTRRTKQNQFNIEISDSGIGIPADKINTVFERYNRVLDDKSEQITGAGIGLALVKALVESHQGNITIESELGKGTTVSINLPIINEVNDLQVSPHSNDEVIAMELMGLSSQTVTFQQTPPVSNALYDSDKPSILVIEDNQDMRNFISTSISQDYQVSTAINGRQGLEQAIKEVPDLIISDVMMPGMDGYEVTHALRTNQVTSHIPIILLTARGDRESRLKGWQNKTDEYLTKPFDIEELLIRIDNLLSIRDILCKRFGEELNIGNNSTQFDISEPSPEQKREKDFVAKLEVIVASCYMQPDIKMAEIAAKIYMSERQLYRKLRAILDISPNHYLRSYRLKIAASLLDQGRPVTNVMIDCGFSTHSYFSKCFKAQYGCSPSEFKQQLESKSNN